MKKIKTVQVREKTLRNAITNKYGSYDSSLDEQLETAAMNRQMIDKMHQEILEGDLVSMSVGSMGQTKSEINPLIAAYDKAQRTYIQQLAALGLNRMSEKKQDSPDTTRKEDKMSEFFNNLK